MLRYFSTLCSVFCLDYATKRLAENKLPYGISKEVIKNKLYWKRIKNNGMAYNTLEQKPNVVRGVASVLSLYCFYTMHKEAKNGNTKTAYGLAMLLGGAFGNLYDRFTKGGVTDFIYIKAKKAPIFNIADIAIAFGGIIYFVTNLTKKP